eukprot:CAMPEP_0174376922 /NCGR_PEP_ID=MMETSP0811_2-20130205/120074_1 /TAXON_ID=73025 ORGANISM="Eutreptiella gymnastica-like, Strain CCMP1594" /NCGR_SAMPLE_ID=MMETSP0811_2 /ASSEMBLY_ACC=CAM_ASM_000667 /LENGTH=52 /DNA_ID=CAMNT_0015528641 /DNA_START=64 /DNA_END=219 /DNA_ORIENTATION=+
MSTPKGPTVRLCDNANRRKGIAFGFHLAAEDCPWSLAASPHARGVTDTLAPG